MKVWHATEDQIREAIAETGLKVYDEWDGYGRSNGISRDGRALRFRLGLNTAQARNGEGFLPYQRRSTNSGRKVAAVCWHGHRDFMRALYRRSPEARVKTALADYRGAADFEYQYSDTYGHGNGWNVSYGQACGCEECVRDEWERAA